MNANEAIAEGEVILDTSFLLKRLNECRLIAKLTQLRAVSAGLAAFSAVAAAIAGGSGLFTGQKSAALVLVALLFTGFSIFTRIYANPRTLRQALRIVRREFEYFARVIDGELGSFDDERASVRRGKRPQLENSHVVCLRALRYSLILKANRIKELLTTSRWEDELKAYALAASPFPIHSNVEEDPQVTISIHELGARISMMVEKAKATGRPSNLTRRAELREAA